MSASAPSPNDKYIRELIELVGNTLKKKRSQRNITQAAVADEAGIPLASYQQMEAGKKLRYRIDTFLRVLYVFRCDIMLALNMQTPQPTRISPKREILHQRLDEMLSGGDKWLTIAETNIDSLWERFKAERTKQPKAAG